MTFYTKISEKFFHIIQLSGIVQDVFSKPAFRFVLRVELAKALNKGQGFKKFLKRFHKIIFERRFNFNRLFRYPQRRERFRRRTRRDGRRRWRRRQREQARQR